MNSDTMHQDIELEKTRMGLISTSHQVMAWLAETKGKTLPELAITKMISHAQACANWLIDSVGFADFDDWLDALSEDDRDEFESAILPFVLLIDHARTYGVYEMVGESLKGKSFCDKFPMSLTEELRSILKLTAMRYQDLEGVTGSAAEILLPKLIDEDSRIMLHPELHVDINGLAKLELYRQIITCTFTGWIPEERGVRALNALGSKVDEGLAARLIERVANHVIFTSPSKCPSMRLKLTGSMEVTQDECSQRMAIAMGAIAGNLENPQIPFLVEAVDLCPEYRQHVMRDDMFDAIKQMINNHKPEVTVASVCEGLAHACQALKLDQYDINYLLLKTMGSHTNGKIRDLEKVPAAVGLRPLLVLSTSRNYNTIVADVLPRLTCELLKISDRTVVMEAAGADDKIKGFMYKLTQDLQFLKDVKDSKTLDNCFGGDLGL